MYCFVRIPVHCKVFAWRTSRTIKALLPLGETIISRKLTCTIKAISQVARPTAAIVGALGIYALCVKVTATLKWLAFVKICIRKMGNKFKHPQLGLILNEQIMIFFFPILIYSFICLFFLSFFQKLGFNLASE